MAFAGNDLVNFIGVPVAAFNAYTEWSASGLSAGSFPMDVLASKVPTNNWLLFGAGMVMVITLWFSTKAKDVVKTSLDLSNQGDTKERFQPNFLSRGFVRFAMGASKVTSFILPISWQDKIEQQFEQPVSISKGAKEYHSAKVLQAFHHAQKRLQYVRLCLIVEQQLSPQVPIQ